MLALTEMGARLAKVPHIDLAEDESRSRMLALQRSRYEFIVTTLGAPKAELLALDLDSLGVKAFEVNATHEEFLANLDRYVTARKSADRLFYYSKILSVDASRFTGKHFTHFVKSGFLVSELDEYQTSIRDAIKHTAIDGITVRHDVSEPLPPAAKQIMQFADNNHCRVLVSVKLAGASVAKLQANDRATATCVAQAMVLSRCHDAVDYVFDTFMDVDRGYYPRHAFIDRRFNPRAPAKVFSMVNAILSDYDSFSLVDDKQGKPDEIRFIADTDDFALLSGNRNSMLATLSRFDSSARAYDLINSEEQTVQELLGDFDDLDSNDLEQCLLIGTNRSR